VTGQDVASTAEPWESEQERRERIRRERYRQISQDLKLENELKIMDRELNLIDEEDVSTDEKNFSTW
jgi:hypothetical protein